MFTRSVRRFALPVFLAVVLLAALVGPAQAAFPQSFSFQFDRTRNPGDCYNDGGGSDWSGTSNVENDNNNNYASVYDLDRNSDKLECVDMGFPSFSGSVLGVRLRLEFWTRKNVELKELELVVGGSTTGDNKATENGRWDSSGWRWRDETYGSSSDLWSTSLSASDISNTNFGFMVQSRHWDGDNNADMLLARVRMTITHQTTVTLTSFSPNNGVVGSQVTVTGSGFNELSSGQLGCSFTTAGGRTMTFGATRLSSTSIRCDGGPTVYPWENPSLSFSFKPANSQGYISAGTYTYNDMSTPSTISSISPTVVTLDGSSQTFTLGGSPPTGSHVFIAIVPAQSGCGDRVATYALTSSSISVTLDTPLAPVAEYGLCISTSGNVEQGFVKQQAPGTRFRVVTAEAGSVASAWPRVLGASVANTLQLTFATAFDYSSPDTRFGVGDPGCPSASVTNAASYTSASSPITLPSVSAGDSRTNGRLCMSTNAGTSWVEQTAVGVVQLVPFGVSAVLPNTWGGGSLPVLTFTGAGATDRGTFHGFVADGSNCGSVTVLSPTPFGASPSVALVPAVAGSQVYRVCQSQDGGATWANTVTTVTVTSNVLGTLTSIGPVSRYLIGGRPETIQFVGVTPTSTTVARIINSGTSCAEGNRIVDVPLADSNTAVVNLPYPTGTGTGRTFRVCLSTSGPTGSFVYQSDSSGKRPLTKTNTKSTLLGSFSPSVFGNGVEVTGTFSATPSNWNQYPGANFALAIPGGCNSETLRMWKATFTGSTPTFTISLPASYPVPKTTLATCFSWGGDFIEQDTTVDVLTISPLVIQSVTPSAVLVNNSVSLLFDGALGSPNTKVALAAPGACDATRYLETDFGVADTGTSKLMDGGTFPPVAEPTVVVCLSINDGTTWVEQSLASLSVTANPNSAVVTSLAPNAVGAGTPMAVTMAGSVEPDGRIAFAAPGNCQVGPRVGGVNVFETGSFSGTLAAAITTPGRYAMCFSSDSGSGYADASWSEQVGADTSFVVVGAAPTSIAAVGLNIWGVGSTPTLSVAKSAVAAGIQCATCAVGFSRSSCADGTVEGVTPLAEAASLVLPLGAPMLTGGSYDVCFSSSSLSSGFVVQTSPGSVDVIDATATTVSDISPKRVGNGTTPTFTLTGAVGSSSTRVAFSLDSSCTTGLVPSGGDALAIGGEAAWTLPSPGFTSGGVYNLCYSVDSGSTFVRQTSFTVEVLEALPGSITGLSPRVIGSGAANTFNLTGIPTGPGSFVAFVLTGESCNDEAQRVGLLDLTEATTNVPALVPILDTGVANAVYDTCYTVGADAWVRQTDVNAADVTVVVPVLGAVTTLTPSVVAVNVAETLTFGGLVGSPNVIVGFGVGSCTGTIVGKTPVTVTGAPVPLGSAITETAVYFVCLSTDNGVSWVTQNPVAVTLEVVAAEPTSVTAISPFVIGTGAAASITPLGSFKETPATMVGFATSSACTTMVTTLDVSGGAGPAYPLASGTINVPTSTVYSVCFTVDGGATWVAQSGVSLTVEVATSTSLTAFSPVMLGDGAQGVDLTATVAGAQSSASAHIGFAAPGGCGAPLNVVPYTTTGELDMSSGAGLSPGSYVLCYSVESSSTGFVEQTLTPTVTVVTAATAAATIVEVLPSYALTAATDVSIGVRLSPSGKAGIPFATAAYGVDPAGTCASGVEGVTLLSSLADAPASIDDLEANWLFGRRTGTVTTTTTSAAFCLTVNGGATWAPIGSGAGSVSVTATAPSSGLVAAVPNGVQVGTGSPVFFRGIAPAQGPNTMVAFAAGAGANCTTGRESGLTMTDAVLEPLTPMLSTAGPYTVCVSHDSGASWVPQSAQMTAIDCTTRSSCSECRADPLCGWCASTSSCVVGALLGDSCNTNQAVCTPTFGAACALETCPVPTAVSPSSVVSTGGNVLTIDTQLAVPVPDLECKFVLTGTVVTAYTPASQVSPTQVVCPAAPAGLGILSAEVSLTQTVGSNERVPYNADGAAITLNYYDCRDTIGCETCYDATARPDCGYCLLATECMSQSQCNEAVGFNETLAAAGGTNPLTPVWVAPSEATSECPAVSSIAPATGVTTGGIELTLTGNLFVDTSGRVVTGSAGRSLVSSGATFQYACSLGDVESATNATVTSGTTATCALPESVRDGSVDLVVLLNGVAVSRTASAFNYVPPPAPIPPPPSQTTRNVLIGTTATVILIIIVAVIIGLLLVKRKRDQEKLLEPPTMTPAEIEATVFGRPLALGVDGKATLPLLSKFINEFVFDYEFLALLAEVTPATEVDRVAKAAVIVYEHAGHSLDLLLYQVSREVTIALTLQTLFRTNSMATKMFKLFSKLKGLGYVRNTLGRPLNKILLEDDVDVDALKRGKGQGAQFQLLKLSQGLFNSVRMSLPAVPAEFRYLFRAVQVAIQERFPVRADELAPLMADALRAGLEDTSSLYAEGSETFAHLSSVSQQVTDDTHTLAAVLEPVHQDLVAYEDSVHELASKLQEMSDLVEKLAGATDPTSPAARRLLADLQASANSVGVGGFFFLRFLVPAITAPESYGLVHEPPDVMQRKLLVLLGKVIQNLSNQKEFGGKEKHMVQMNAFITSNAETISTLLDDLAKVPANATPRDELEYAAVPSKHLEGALVFLYKHAKAMRAKLLDKLAETTIGAVELPPAAVEQRREAGELMCSLLDEIEAAQASGSRGSRIDYDQLRSLPFTTCMNQLPPLLCGWGEGGSSL